MQEISEECWSHYDANSPRLPSSHNYQEYMVIIHFSLWLLSQLISNRESTVIKFQRWNYNKDLWIKIMIMIFYSPWNHRDDSRLVPCQWETLLQSNVASHWLGANLESALNQLFWKKKWICLSHNCSRCSPLWYDWWYVIWLYKQSDRKKDKK